MTFRTSLTRTQVGLTLIELMVTIAVIAILATIAVPSFQEIIKRNQISAQTNELIALIHLARNESIRRNPVNTETVLLELANVGAGAWEGAVYPPGTDVTQPGCPTGAIRCASHTRGQLSAPEIKIYFDNRGYSVNSGVTALEEVVLTLRHKDCTNQHAREVIIRRTGQVSTETVDCP